MAHGRWTPGIEGRFSDTPAGASQQNREPIDEPRMHVAEGDVKSSPHYAAARANFARSRARQSQAQVRGASEMRQRKICSRYGLREGNAANQVSWRKVTIGKQSARSAMPKISRSSYPDPVTKRS